MKNLLIAFLAVFVAATCAHAGIEFGCTDRALLKYISIQKALAGDELAAARIAASELEKLGQSWETTKTNRCGELTRHASEIAEAESIELAREAFKALSDALIAAIETDGLGHGQVYKMYCPMAFNDTGAAWIQDTPALRNPYFGASMLMCGMQQATIGQPVDTSEAKTSTEHSGYSH